MAEFRADIENNRIKGEVTIWTGVAGGIIVATIASWALNAIYDQDSDINTYNPKELTVNHFSPQPGLNCTGLQPERTDEIIASTIVCETVTE